MEAEACVQIHWTCGSIEEARHISRQLVQLRLVACATIIPWVESIFLWDQQLNETQETKVIFKTLETRFSDVKNFILQHAKYEVPEILALPIIEGHGEYLQWVSLATQTIKE